MAHEALRAAGYPRRPALGRMMKPLSFETASDREGSSHLGWAGDSVLYARFQGGLSAELGARVAVQLQSLISSASAVHYFCDASRLTRYDLLARSAFVRVALANRRRFASFTFLLFGETVSSAARTFAAGLGDGVEFFVDVSEFERKLLRLAPLARHRIEGPNSTPHESTHRSTR